MPKPRILLVDTGGTMTTLARDRRDVFEYWAGRQRTSCAELLKQLPEASDIAEISVADFAPIPSTSVSSETWSSLHAIVRAATDADGILVSHGTATLEETAYFLHLTTSGTRPLVVVGSILPPNVLGTDALSNLLAGVRVAASEAAHGLGCVVVSNSRVYSARSVVKTGHHEVDAFDSHDRQIVGMVYPQGALEFTAQNRRRHTKSSEFLDADLTALPRVDVVPAYAGADGVAIDAAVAAGASGIVISCLPPGVPAADQLPAVDAALVSGVAIIYAPRALRGSVRPWREFVDSGIVAAGDLSPQKSRILAMLALQRTSDSQELQRIFDAY